MGDLFRAGTETTATTLTWAIIYLARNPDIQKQLRTEVDEVSQGNINIDICIKLQNSAGLHILQVAAKQLLSSSCKNLVRLNLNFKKLERLLLLEDGLLSFP